MFSNSEQIASARKTKHDFHRRRARFWTILFFVANALFALVLLGMGIGSFAVILMLIEALFSGTQKVPITEILSMLVGVVIWVPLLVPYVWWLLHNLREIRNKHLRLAAGYAQRSAEEILAGRSGKDPFGLFLRGFDFEAQSTSYSGPNPEVGSREAQIYGRPVEALLLEMLSEDVPLIALADPRDAEPLPGVSRFETVPTKWVEFIYELLPDAFPIILYLTSLSAGIKREINILESSGHSRKAIVIVSRSCAAKNSPIGKLVVSMLSGFDHIVFEQMDKTWSRKHEVQFHSRLQECLRVLEHESQSKQLLRRKKAGNFKALTPTWPKISFDFLKGPALSAYLLMAAMIILHAIFVLLIGGWDAPFLIGSITFIVTWPTLFIALAVIKGITYILGFAPGPGDNPNFPGFSRLFKRVKKYSQTLK